jgi:hypothetical protein
MAHDLADILAYQVGSGARGQRMEAAQTTGVAECGNYDAREDSVALPPWCVDVVPLVPAHMQ